MHEEDFPCPQCGKMVSKTDRYCKNCGASLAGLPEALPTVPPPSPPQVTEAPYERRFSLGQRLYRLLIAPSEAMKDIALAPDYTGYFAILTLQFALTIVALTIAMQRLQLVGPYSSQISSIVTTILFVAIVIAPLLIILRWLVKSFLIKYTGDSGSGWNFKTAASVTGYAYMADLIFTLLGIVISWLALPTFRLDTTDLNAAIQLMNNYRAQINTLRFTFTLPVSFIGLIWKSYLGGLGTHFGTNRRCSVRTGFSVFFVLGLIGLLISFAVTL